MLQECDVQTIVLVDAGQLPSVEGTVWARSQSQRDAKSVSSIQSSLKPTSVGAALQWKISEDDDDASDSEKMVICEDESTGTLLTLPLWCSERGLKWLSIHLSVCPIDRQQH